MNNLGLSGFLLGFLLGGAVDSGECEDDEVGGF